MKYRNVIQGSFISRPNRFIANVGIEGCPVVAHVKNTGRCRELLLPGAEVYLEKSVSPQRKTAFDLIAVRKANGLLINIDSQAPNRVVREWLDHQNYNSFRPEFIYGNSRVDFYMEKGKKRYLLEVKGCTLEREGIGYFPDAPTERGVKHLLELKKAVLEGYNASVAFVIQMDGISEVRPNTETDPDFSKALKEAQETGVKVLFLLCHVEPDSLTIIQAIESDNSMRKIQKKKGAGE